ncbi:MAG: hypothetical protein HY956_06590 [Deltaproteobacteria bacterium]|nr:hypothetical protein [Deltaproteobacteria bacterium]
MIKAPLLGLFCFILFLAVHVIVFRTKELKERFRALVIIFLSVIPVYLIGYWVIPSGYMVLAPLGNSPADQWLSLETVYRLTWLGNFLAGFGLYVFLFLGYCQFYFIVDRSISVRIMMEIEGSAAKKMSFEEIRGAYSFEVIFRRRLGHMVEGGYLKDEGGYYSNTKKGRAEALLFAFLKDFLRLGKGG